MNDKLHTVRLSVEIASFEKSDLPEVGEQLVEDVSGFFLERFENVTVRVTVGNGQGTSGNNPGGGERRSDDRKNQMATDKTRSKFAKLAQDVYCAMRTTDIRVTEDYFITVCLASHFGAKARARGQPKWSVTFNGTLRHPGWLKGGKIIPTFAGVGIPIKFETDDFNEARDKFNELERKAYAEARERLKKGEWRRRPTSSRSPSTIDTDGGDMV